TVSIDAHAPREREQSRRAEPLPPSAEEVPERHAALEMDDAGGVAGPAADAWRDEHDAAVRKQLEVNPRRRQGADAPDVRRRRRVIARAHSDRRRYRHLGLIVAVLALAGCGGG